MKNKILKLIPVLILIALDIISIFTFELFSFQLSIKNVTISFVFLITSWIVTFIFSGNKKFLIGMSVYFFLIISTFLIYTSFTLPDWLENTILIFDFTFLCPLGALCDLFSKPFAYYTPYAYYFFILVIISFYVVYFIGKYVKSKRKED